MSSQPKVFFICDRQKCGLNCNPECHHTSDINHAIRAEGDFKKNLTDGSMWQVAISVDGEIVTDRQKIIF